MDLINNPSRNIAPRRYSFEEQKQLGIDGEKQLDTFFSRWYIIREVPMELQKEGVDRFFIPRYGEVGFPRLVEYKTDYKDTGKAFVETHSVIRAGQPDIKGWLHTSKADWLVYFLVKYETAFVLSFPTLRKFVSLWEIEEHCQRKHSINGDYKGAGLLVPISLMLRASHAVFKVPTLANSSSL